MIAEHKGHYVIQRRVGWRKTEGRGEGLIKTPSPHAKASINDRGAKAIPFSVTPAPDTQSFDHDQGMTEAPVGINRSLHVCHLSVAKVGATYRLALQIAQRRRIQPHRVRVSVAWRVLAGYQDKGLGGAVDLNDIPKEIHAFRTGRRGATSAVDTYVVQRQRAAGGNVDRDARLDCVLRSGKQQRELSFEAAAHREQARRIRSALSAVRFDGHRDPLHRAGRTCLQRRKEIVGLSEPRGVSIARRSNASGRLNTGNVSLSQRGDACTPGAAVETAGIEDKRRNQRQQDASLGSGHLRFLPVGCFERAARTGSACFPPLGEVSKK